MGFAALSFLRSPSPPRMTTKHQNPCSLRDTLGRSFELEFYRHKSADGEAFFNKHAYPPIISQGENETPTLYHPPAHYHLLNDECFTVLSGSGTWYFWDRAVRLKKGDEITVLARAWHRLEGHPSLDEPLTIAARYKEGSAAEEEERFFRNILSYLADCHEAGVAPSAFQIMVFFMHNKMMPGLKTPGPEWLNFLLNTILGYSMGVIGEYLLGYQVSYPEYY